MAIATHGKPSFEEMRNSYVNVPTMNLPKKAARNFYNFTLPKNQNQVIFFFTIDARNASYTGQLIIKMNEDSCSCRSIMCDDKMKVLYNYSKKGLKSSRPFSLPSDPFDLDKK
jgi:hypothetical protein